MGSCVQVAPWDMMEEDEGEAAAQQQQQSGRPLQPIPFLNATANMADGPNTTVTDKVQLRNSDRVQLRHSLHSQLGHTTPGRVIPCHVVLSICCPLLMQPTTANTWFQCYSTVAEVVV